jgi:hypothetical protein
VHTEAHKVAFDTSATAPSGDGEASNSASQNLYINRDPIFSEFPIAELQPHKETLNASEDSGCKDGGQISISNRPETFKKPFAEFPIGPMDLSAPENKGIDERGEGFSKVGGQVDDGCAYMYKCTLLDTTRFKAVMAMNLSELRS